MIDWENYKRTDALTLAILGALIGHPSMSKFDGGSGGELENLDVAFDESAYLREWIEW